MAGALLAVGERVGIRRVVGGDRDEFVALMVESAAFHRPWVDPPKTGVAFDAWLATRDGVGNEGFVVCESGEGRIVGVINVNAIVRGAFQSGYLGYYAGAPYAGKGYMTEGLRLVVGYAFGAMGLHRVEANVQPGNGASIALVKRCGFRLEGFSPRYLKVFGDWRDHERWALVGD